MDNDVDIFGNCKFCGKKVISAGGCQHLLCLPSKNNDDYAYSTIEEYENIVGHKVNEAFKMGWDMARTKNSHIEQLSQQYSNHER